MVDVDPHTTVLVENRLLGFIPSACQADIQLHLILPCRHDPLV